ncbi:MAG: methane monooxygenase/ammonia monooxygenase subunit C [Gammaproteobacteria bacterium]|nr:methane monooxygenase/ammonia monooxygenase subunit C [Gammaproteobacteria bacterium]
MSITADRIKEDSLETTELTADNVGIPWKMVFTTLIGLVTVLGAYRWYQMNYSFSVGMDYFEPIFQTYWMSLFYTQLTVIAIAGSAALAWLWVSRERDIQSLAPIEELHRYFIFFALLAFVGGIFVVALDVFTEADAAWHQTAIRDTDFTPTHIILFYFMMPTMLVGLLVATLWVHTRLPDFSNRVSIPMLIVAGGPLLVLPSLGYNEWGHTFFYAEELFAAPIHWGFVVLSWGFFGFGGVIVQCLSRVTQLTKVELAPVKP